MWEMQKIVKIVDENRNLLMEVAIFNIDPPAKIIMAEGSVFVATDTPDEYVEEHRWAKGSKVQKVQAGDSGGYGDDAGYYT